MPGGPEGALRVLYLEDSKTDALMVEAMLVHSDVADFAVTCAGDLAEGLAAAAQDPYDVIVSDLTLPDSEGLATFESVRDSAPGVPVVVVTADGDLSLGRQAVAGGARPTSSSRATWTVNGSPSCWCSQSNASGTHPPAAWPIPSPRVGSLCEVPGARPPRNAPKPQGTPSFVPSCAKARGRW